MAGANGPAASRILRTASYLVPGVDSRYDLHMASGSVDRAAWAKVVRRLMDKHASGRKATFGKLVGVDPRTVTDWLGEVYSVRDAMVRQVAEKTGESAIDLLIEVGVIRARDLPSSPIPAEDAWIVELVAKYGFSPDKQKQLTALLLEQARREREESKRRIEEQLTVLGGTADDEERG